MARRNTTLGPGPGQLDNNQRMSVMFTVTVVNERADREMRTVDAALDRLRSMGSQQYRNKSRRASTTTRPGTNPASTMDNGSMQSVVSILTGQIEGQVEDIMADAMKEGVEFTRQWVRAAVTPYGRYRLSQGRGRSAGREDTGAMIDAVTWNVGKSLAFTSRGSGSVRRRGRTVVGGARRATINGFFGWDEPEVYVVAQEKGFKHARSGTATTPRKRPYYAPSRSVPGALSLGSALLPTRQYLLERLRRIRV